MRHGDKVNNLGRKTAHRRALLANLACSLITNRRINTTLAKAKALRTYVEPLITKSKDDSTHSRRVVFSYLRDKIAVSSLFKDVAPKISDRPGGYTRIIKLAPRMGDNAEMCFIELVDFNETMLGVNKTAKEKAPKTRRSRKKATKAEDATVVEDGSANTVAEKETAKPKKAAAKKKKTDTE